MQNIALLILLAILYGNAQAEPFGVRLSREAIERTKYRITYDGSYYAIDYPGGDVPGHIGVCTDVIIRSYRALGIDLQSLVHEDMAYNFQAYPSRRIWGLSKPDSNIDHRRVPNLREFFRRNGNELTVSSDPKDYRSGDIVTWNLPGNLPHIGVVTHNLSSENGNPLIVHNIGAGPKLEDILFKFEITGHYTYVPDT